MVEPTLFKSSLDLNYKIIIPQMYIYVKHTHIHANIHTLKYIHF